MKHIYNLTIDTSAANGVQHRHNTNRDVYVANKNTGTISGEVCNANRNRRVESPINYRGIEFALLRVLSTPPHLLKNSFCSDPLKNCVVVHELHKKQASNCLYLPGLLRPHAIQGGDQWNNIKVII